MRNRELAEQLSICRSSINASALPNSHVKRVCLTTTRARDKPSQTALYQNKPRPRSSRNDSSLQNLTGARELIEPEEFVPKRAREETEASGVSGRLPRRAV